MIALVKLRPWSANFSKANVLKPLQPTWMAQPLSRHMSASYQCLYRHIHTSIVPTSHKRVLGVIAHINSGKTTTSEAMLYRSGALSRMGNVDVGDTTMDFLPAERERGITITAAAICFSWRNHEIFLVDSPGHLDFTFEVERALRVMDGVVVLLDAVAGVQPQTETVWRQADANGLPRLIFVNKMDREGADFKRTLEDIRRVFNATPVVTHIPIFDDSNFFMGIYNIMEQFTSSASPTSGFSGKSPNEEDLELSYDRMSDSQKSQIDSAAEQLVETCAEVDDDIMDAWVGGSSVGGDLIQKAIREACIQRSLVPVLCGSSLKEIGVQSLLDSILSFLPSPLERGPFHASAITDGADTQVFASDHEKSPFLAYAFKVTHDKHRGRMVLLRALSGRLESRSPFLNTTKGKREQPTRLLRILADKYEEVESVETGDIFAAVRYNLSVVQFTEQTPTQTGGPCSILTQTACACM